MINISKSESSWQIQQPAQQQQQEPAIDTFKMNTILTISAYVSTYLVSIFITIHIIIFLCLFCRLLRVKFGTKIKPDGRKAILVTGATSGIGLVISKYFFKLGFTVICGYFNDQEPGYAELLELSIKSSSTLLPTVLSTTSLMINEDDQQYKKKQQSNVVSSRARLFLVRMDVRSKESIEKSSHEIDSILDQYDIELFSLINNAGIARDAPFQWQSREAIRDVTETNLVGVMMVTRQFIYRIIKAKGRIINVSSGLYLFPAPIISLYGSSKSAVAYYSTSLDTDLAKYGASCRCVVPGNFMTTSNILFPNLRTLQDAITKLTPEEKELYKDSIDIYTENMENLIRKRFASGDNNLDPVQVSSIYRVRLPDDVMSCHLNKKKTKENSKFSEKPTIFERLFGWMVEKFDGGSENLEKSGIIESFDYAVRLRSCPRRLYPGNKFYTHFSGPMMEYLPKIFCDSISNLLLMSQIKNK